MKTDLTDKPILIVDDETDIRFLLGTILKQKNIKSVFASSLSEAHALMKKVADFSYIFLDNYLPDGLGVNHIRQFKNRYPTTKLVMVTAHDNATDRERASREGADYFIGKPFSRDVILQTIANFAG